MIPGFLLERRVQRGLVAVTWTLLAASIQTRAAAQDATAGIPPAPGAPVVAPAAEPAAPAAPPADDSGEPPLELSPPGASGAGTQVERAELQRRLRELEDERAHTTNLWPWLAVGTGATAVVFGTAIGVVNAFDCDETSKCSSPPWATFVVVLGAAIGTAGAIWLVHADQGIAELEIKKHQVQTDLDRLDHARLRRGGLATSNPPAFSLRASF